MNGCKVDVMNNKTYQDGLRESIEILTELKNVTDRENNAFHLVSKFLDDKNTYCDKNGKKIQRGDFLEVNPDDGSWLDLVIRYAGNLIFVSELTDYEPVRLKEVLQGSDNPAVIVGNLLDNRIEFHER